MTGSRDHCQTAVGYLLFHNMCIPDRSCRILISPDQQYFLADLWKQLRQILIHCLHHTLTHHGCRIAVVCRSLSAPPVIDHLREHGIDQLHVQEFLQNLVLADLPFLCSSPHRQDTGAVDQDNIRDLKRDALSGCQLDDHASAVGMPDEGGLLYLHYFHKSAEKIRKSVHIPGFLRFIAAAEAREIKLDHTVPAAVYHTGYGIIHSQIRTPAL